METKVIVGIVLVIAVGFFGYLAFKTTPEQSLFQNNNPKSASTTTENSMEKITKQENRPLKIVNSPKDSSGLADEVSALNALRGLGNTDFGDDEAEIINASLDKSLK